MVVCCICGIEWMPDSVSFHKFPKSDNIRNRWLAAINKRITNFTLNKHAKICGQHFALECFIVTETGKRYLKSYAVPSIFDMPLKKKYILTQSVSTQYFLVLFYIHIVYSFYENIEVTIFPSPYACIYTC
ncbi:THAP domain-containing protein [Ooceraea biroi]|uniref:THAP domain-containing protein n=1 Tax=Ooceraea biroi TaxID=2015173 RepID=A0A026X4L2_OOCBI|nr:THAP domain-containing protein [Ooceraea biroi]